MKGTFYKCDGPNCDVIAPAEGDYSLFPAGWWQLQPPHVPGQTNQPMHFHSRDCLRNYVLGMSQQEESGATLSITSDARR